MANKNQDWDDLGRSIQDIVDRAVNARDFQKLNQTVSQAVGKAVDMGSEAVRKAMEAAARPTTPPARPVYREVEATVVEEKKDLPVLYAGTWLIVSGIRKLGWVSRFKMYKRTLGESTHCTLERLARSVGKNVKFVRRELQKMINKGLFLEGHMDREETCLITSDETYRHYEQSRLALEERQRQEAAASAPKVSSPHDPQVQEVLDRGNAFIAQIRACNDAIPGEEISEKISRMELIVRRIFERAEAHPEVVPDLKKLMDYYLPMTVKLLNAYADMDAQPVQGENIQASKKEIEATLDTLNLAFEKLLDDLFRDSAMDVSSDISVLNTLLAQEGLTEDGLSQVKKQQTL